MEIIELNHTNLLQALAKNLESAKIQQICFCKVQKAIVIVHREKQVDKEICDKLGYEICECFANGGTICCNEGDFLIGHWSHIANNWLENFTNHFVTWLKNKGLNACYKDNDILIDDYKVCGTCVTQYGSVAYTALAIGINTNLDHIKQICKKPMKKVPKGLSEYGITTAEIEQMFLDFCNYKGNN